MVKRQLKQSNLAKKLKARGDLVQLLSEIRDTSIAALQSKFQNEIIEATEGDLIATFSVNGQLKSYSPIENASIHTHGHLLTASFCDVLLRIQHKNEFLNMGLAYVAGLANGWVTSEEQNEELRERIRKMTASRQKGGAATRKLSPEQEELAKALIHETWTKYVSKSSACERVSAVLARQHGINVSGRTLQKLVADKPGKR